MRLTHVKIKDILGIEELEFDVGGFTTITGSNGSGKTSVLEALKSLGKGGVDATLLRNGATEGEVIWLFDDGAQIRRRVTANNQSLSFRDETGKQTGSPATAVNALIDMISMNPVEFLLSKPKERVNVLLASLPMKADPARIREIVGDDSIPIVGQFALQQIENARTLVFEERTGTNRAAREKEHTISQLQETLPPDPDGQTPSGDDAAIIKRIEEIDAAKDLRIAEIDAKLDGYRTEHQARVQGMRDRIAALQAEVAEEVQAFGITQSRAGEARQTALDGFRAQREPLAASLASIHADRDAVIRARTTREHISTLEVEAESLRSDGLRQTKAIEDLDAYKAELLADLPIDGLEVADGEIFRHGVTFDRLNKAQQVEIAVAIATLRAGALKLVCVDDFEMLDTEHFEAFRDQALAAGLQLIVTRVTDGEFAISTTD